MRFTPRFLPAVFLTLLVVSWGESPPPLMPMPRSVELTEEAFRIEPTFTVQVEAPEDSRAQDGAQRFLARLRNRLGLRIGRPESQGAVVGMTVRVDETAKLLVGMDESYRLEIGPPGMVLTARTDIGALRAMETVLQLLQADEAGWFIPAGEIEDAPRFVWRGLLLDAGRHFMPVDVVKRNLDGMAAVKLNVLHWHLTEDQGFRVESRVFPRLHEMGSDGDYYSQDQIRDVIAYADARGIRVYPEFDMPGHTTSWLVGHPELASVERDYQIQRGWGVFRPAIDPTRDEVYTFLEAFLVEMAALFPDPYLHIGGDEVNSKDWRNSERIQAYMREHGIENEHGLQMRFNERILGILTKLEKRMVGWDEIYQPGLPTDIVIQSWRGREAMEQAAQAGYQSILSHGYYIDLMQSAAFHYLNDPLPEESELAGEAREHVLGGEATMWAELVTPETVDSRIWPRTAAIAERLWSARELRDVESMYARLDVVSARLEEVGLTHLKNRDAMLRRLAAGGPVAPLALLADLVEPVEGYARHKDKTYQQYSPINRLPDIAVADALGARAFAAMVARYRAASDDLVAQGIRETLERWRDNHAAMVELSRRAPGVKELLPLSSTLRDLAELGLAALAGGQSDASAEAVLERARQLHHEVELKVVDAVASLLQP